MDALGVPNGYDRSDPGDKVVVEDDEVKAQELHCIAAE